MKVQIGSELPRELGQNSELPRCGPVMGLKRRLRSAGDHQERQSKWPKIRVSILFPSFPENYFGPMAGGWVGGRWLKARAQPSRQVASPAWILQSCPPLPPHTAPSLPVTKLLAKDQEWSAGSKVTPSPRPEGHQAL